MAQKYASWSAKKTREAGSLPSDFDAEIVEAQFSQKIPDNYPSQGNPIFLYTTLLIADAGDYAGKPEEERTITPFYNLGGKAGDEFEVSEDGYGLIPKEGTDIEATRKGSKFDMWKCALENCGVSDTITDGGDLSKVKKLNGHWRRVADEKLLGKKREFNNNDNRKAKNFPDETLVLVKLINLPGEKVTAAKTTATTATASTASTAAPETDFDGRVTGFLMDVLANAKDNKVQRSTLIGLLSKAAIKEKDRQDIARRGADEEYLKAQAEAGVISYDPAAKPQVVALAA